MKIPNYRFSSARQTVGKVLYETDYPPDLGRERSTAGQRLLIRRCLREGEGGLWGGMRGLEGGSGYSDEGTGRKLSCVGFPLDKLDFMVSPRL
jgi:hypothetical protein